MKKIKFFLVLMTLVFICSNSIPSFSQDTLNTTNGDTTTSSISTAQDTSAFQLDTGKRGFTIKTMFELLRLAKGIGYLLIMVFILGILFIFQKWYVLIRERNDAQKIPVEGLKTMSYDDIQKMFTKIKEDDAVSNEANQQEKVPLLKRIFRRKKATAFQLLHKLYKIFDAQKSTLSFNEETSNFIQYLKDIFNPFMTRLAFLSDTAGALGLLGTVWGMFLVFYKGSPDPDDTLQGMGIALATTIIGLVISIILNSFTTVVSNIFDKHLDFVNNMASVFQDRMMMEEEKHPAKAQQIIVDSTAVSDHLTKQATLAEQRIPARDAPGATQQPAPKLEIPVPAYGPPAEIKIISGDNQSGEVNSKLPEPIIVEVQDSQANPLENETVVFTAEDGAGMFLNNNRVQKILTDDEGRAETRFTLGKTAGEKTIHISVEGSTSRGIKLLAIAKPTPPSKMIELDGNYQSGEMGKRLPLPFTIAIRDQYGNPIPMYEVDFTLKRGSGRFQDSQNSHFTTRTNENGLAEVYFIVGNDRGAREVEAEAKKVEPSRITFEAFAK